MKSVLRYSAAALAAALSMSASAQAQTVSAVPGIEYNTTSIDNFSTTGSMMGGMLVNVCMTSGFGCQDFTWSQISTNFWGVQSAGFFRIRVGSNEDTYSGDWRFDLFGNANLQSVTFSGLSGKTVFDRSEPAPGTPGSADGLDGDLRNFCISLTGPDNCVDFAGASVEYRNRVALNNTFYGDLYESVHIDFSGSVLSGPDRRGGLDDDYSPFYLWMDTDNASAGIDPFEVPEPTSLAMLGLGLVGLATVARRRRA